MSFPLFIGDSTYRGISVNVGLSHLETSARMEDGQIGKNVAHSDEAGNSAVVNESSEYDVVGLRIDWLRKA